MRLVLRLFAPLALLVLGIMSYTPDFNKAFASEKVTLRPSVERQDRLVSVRDTVSGQPVTDALFIRRADHVTITTLDAFRVPAISAYRNPILTTEATDLTFASTIHASDLTQRMAFNQIEISKRFGVRQFREDTFAPRIRLSRTLNPEFIKPPTDSAAVDTEEFANVLVRSVFQVDQSVQLLTAGGRQPMKGESSPEGSNINTSLSKPAPDGDVWNAEVVPDAMRGHSASNVHIEQNVTFRTLRAGLVGALPRAESESTGSLLLKRFTAYPAGSELRRVERAFVRAESA